MLESLAMNSNLVNWLEHSMWNSIKWNRASSFNQNSQNLLTICLMDSNVVKYRPDCQLWIGCPLTPFSTYDKTLSERVELREIRETAHRSSHWKLNSTTPATIFAISDQHSTSRVVQPPPQWKSSKQLTWEMSVKRFPINHFSNSETAIHFKVKSTSSNKWEKWCACPKWKNSCQRNDKSSHSPSCNLWML